MFGLENIRRRTREREKIDTIWYAKRHKLWVAISLSQKKSYYHGERQLIATVFTETNHKAATTMPEPEKFCKTSTAKFIESDTSANDSLEISLFPLWPNTCLRQRLNSAEITWNRHQTPAAQHHLHCNLRCIRAPWARAGIFKIVDRLVMPRAAHARWHSTVLEPIFDASFQTSGIKIPGDNFAKNVPQEEPPLTDYPSAPTDIATLWSTSASPSSAPFKLVMS